MQNRLLKYLLFAFITIVLLSCSIFQGSGIKIEHQSGNFWKITKGETTVWVVGSFRVGNESMYPLPDAIEDAFDKSDIYVTEADFSKEENIQLMRDRSEFHDGTTLQSILSPITWNKLEAQFQEIGIGEQFYTYAKPWHVSTMLNYFNYKRMGFTLDFSIDKHFNKMASSRKKIYSLESIPEILEFWENASVDAELFLHGTNVSLQFNKENFSDIHNTWLSGDLNIIERGYADLKNKAPVYYDILLKADNERNTKIANKIKEYLNTDKTYFVVMSAWDLVGENRVLDLLKTSY
jgi:uncharacterized protein YbaP (TraB family)